LRFGKVKIGEKLKKRETGLGQRLCFTGELEGREGDQNSPKSGKVQRGVGTKEYRPSASRKRGKETDKKGAVEGGVGGGGAGGRGGGGRWGKRGGGGAFLRAGCSYSRG